MTEKTRRVQILAIVRLCYVAVCVIYFAAFTFVPFRVFYGTPVANLVYLAIPLAGMLLLLIDLITRRNMFSLQYVLLLILFFFAYLASIVVNRKYDFMGNAKLMIWMGIQVFLLCAPDDEFSFTDHLRHLRVLADIFIAIWLVGALISLGQYCIQYGGYMANIAEGKLRYSRQGFIENRLFGVFTDPNYAAVCSLVAIGLAALVLYLRKGRGFLKVYYIASIVLQSFYVVLSGSRTAILSGIIAGAFAAAVLAYRYFRQKRTGVRAIATLLCAVLCAAVVWGSITGLKVGLSYVPEAVAGLQLTNLVPTGENGNGIITPSGPVNLEREDVVDTTNISNNRFAIWRDYLKVFTKTPLFGTSPRKPLDYVKDRFPNMYVVGKEYLVHNGYLGVLVGTGLLGTIPIALWFLLVALRAVRYLFSDRTRSDQRYGVILILTTLLICPLLSAFFMMEIFFSMDISTFLFWPLAGYLLCFLRQAERNDGPRHTRFFGEAKESAAN